MAKRLINRLTPLAVKRATAGAHLDGNGLILYVGKSASADGGGKSWIFRYKIRGRSTDMGLGSADIVTLTEARAKATECRKLLIDGIDPLTHRRAVLRERELAAMSARTFEECAKAYIAIHEAGWRNDKHRKQWTSTLTKYAYPKIGALDVREIGTPHVMRVLEPIWLKKNETASRLRGRIEAILDWAAVHGHRSGDNPARWKGHLDKLLPAPGKVQRETSKHHAALPYQEIGAFMRDLRGREGIAARALEFAVLTVARSGEVRHAVWQEIDLAARLWTVPAGRMKAGREHRVPLSGAAVTLLEALPRRDNYVFAAPRLGPLSDMSLTAVLKRMGRADLTAHGFRSSFRDWAGETTAHPREVIEHALAHQLKDQAEAAYQRGDLLVKRTVLMADWARHCVTVPDAAGVLPMRKRKVAK
nr:site-specific integrase [Paraburkholderia nodosa]